MLQVVLCLRKCDRGPPLLPVPRRDGARLKWETPADPRVNLPEYLLKVPPGCLKWPLQAMKRWRICRLPFQIFS